jgi:hypothetical protein
MGAGNSLGMVICPAESAIRQGPSSTAVTIPNSRPPLKFMLPTRQIAIRPALVPP